MELRHNLKERTIGECLKRWAAQMSRPQNARRVTLSREWTKQAPDAPGVYSVFRNGSVIIYVGETGNLRGRMSDMLDSRRHVLRRSLGRSLFSKRRGFVAATAKDKFPQRFEDLLNHYIQRRLRICMAPVVLGRKELEERLIDLHDPKFNKKKRREK